MLSIGTGRRIEAIFGIFLPVVVRVVVVVVMLVTFAEAEDLATLLRLVCDDISLLFKASNNSFHDWPKELNPKTPRHQLYVKNYLLCI